MQKRIFETVGVLLLLLFFGCAKVGSLDGGQVDKQPPRLDSLRSTRNFQTNFTGRSIELKFDEWLKLDDAANQIVVSPPLAARPDIKLKGKSVILTFEKNEILRPNTTYTVQFGTSIKDFTEGNAVRKLKYVFSTGPVLDSLKITGRVVDAQTGQPQIKMAVALYEDFSDSILLKERPYYFARTDSSGNFSIENVRPGEFKIVAFEGKNTLKLTWSAAELLAFSDKKITAGDTSKTENLVLRLSKQQPDFKISSREVSRFGISKIGFSRQPDAPVFPKTDLPDVKFVLENFGDSLFVWYDLPADSLATPWFFTLGNDTVRMKTLNRADFFSKKNLTFSGAPAPNLGGQRGGSRPRGRGKDAEKTSEIPIKSVVFRPGQNTLPLFNLPISETDTSKFFLQEDTLPTPIRNFLLEKDSVSPRKLHFSFENKPEKRYSLFLLPGALTDFWGGKNTDTLRINFNFLPKAQLGGLAVAMKNLTPGAAYILQIFNGNILEEQRIFTATAAENRLEIPNLPAVAIDIRLIEDVNKNGRWDTGNYFQHQQPEPIFNKKTDPLKPGNWDLEVSLDVKNPSAGNRK